MTIQNNIPAMRAYNRLKGNQSALSKNLQKLSSGYKVNSAADDAAGIAVSEKMRALITGMDRAEENCNEGISLLQTDLCSYAINTKLKEKLLNYLNSCFCASFDINFNPKQNKNESEYFLKDRLSAIEYQSGRIKAPIHLFYYSKN